MSMTQEHAAERGVAGEIIQLAQRVLHLEAQVADLQRVTGTREVHDSSLEQAPAAALAARPLFTVEDSPASPSEAQPALPPHKASAPRRSFDLVRDSQYWLNKVGIGLVLLGVAFLFKHSVDQGWLTPAIRVLFGTLLGGGLIGLGVAVRDRRQHFSQVVQGGGVGILYLSIFAAFQLYDLLPYPVALLAMCGVTTLTFGLAVWQNAQVLALLAAGGGLSTPFLLDNGVDNIAGLIGYTCLILAGTSAILLVRPWRSLLLKTFVGGWAIIGISAISFSFGHTNDALDRAALQGGISFGWLIFAVLPILGVELRAAASKSGGKVGQNDLTLHGLSLLTPLVALGLSLGSWGLSERAWGDIAAAGAGVYALAAWGLRGRAATGRLSVTHVCAALILLTISFVLLLDGALLYAAVAIEALLIHYVAVRSGSRRLAVLGHALFVWLAGWTVLRLIDGTRDGTLVNPQDAAELLGFGLALVVARLLRQRQLAACYGVVLHVLVLGWLGRECSQMQDGNGLITVAWGVYGVALLLVGLRRDATLVVGLGLATLALVVGKLFVVDLAELEAIWRIMLFLGFGGVLLTLSYFFQSLWRPAATRQP